MKRSKLITLYFFLVLGIGAILTFFGNEKISMYGPIIYMLTGFPIIFGLFYLNFYQFSAQLKKTRPDLFEKYILHYSVLKGKVITTSSLFNNLDFNFKEIKSKELSEKYKLTMKIFRLAILSIILIIPLVIGLIMFK